MVQRDFELDRVLILSNVPKDCEDRIVYNELDAVLGIGKCKLLDRRSDKTKRCQFVLTEITGSISQMSIPAEIGGPEVGPWYTQVVHVAAETPEQGREEEFQTRLISFLKKRGNH